MTKEDLIIEFHKKMDRVEKEFFENINSRRKAQQNLENNYMIDLYGEIGLPNTNPETISVPFNFEFYIKGHRCRIAHRFEIVVFRY
ncbi:hypothetical protein [Flavobacterium sp.]|uniref:hypothetical protein n=1 Tax=Flavobacterium sp. TaxID=239 RepID=UPI001B607E1E|nr:hypothetical protein [Flavobacterium sp.]MBP6182649.1 hypothetical protein [Flavobacterium sp.]